MTGSSSDWEAQVELWLARLAQDRQTITYAALAEKAGIPAPHRIHKLTAFLETLMEIDARLEMPQRSAVVVSRTNGLPGNGFFDKLHELGLMSAEENRHDLHNRMMAALNTSRP